MSSSGPGFYSVASSNAYAGLVKTVLDGKVVEAMRGRLIQFRGCTLTSLPRTEDEFLVARKIAAYNFVRAFSEIKFDAHVSRALFCGPPYGKTLTEFLGEVDAEQAFPGKIRDAESRLKTYRDVLHNLRAIRDPEDLATRAKAYVKRMATAAKSAVDGEAVLNIDNVSSNHSPETLLKVVDNVKQLLPEMQLSYVDPAICGNGKTVHPGKTDRGFFTPDAAFSNHGKKTAVELKEGRVNVSEMLQVFKYLQKYDKVILVCREELEKKIGTRSKGEFLKWVDGMRSNSEVESNRLDMRKGKTYRACKRMRWSVEEDCVAVAAIESQCWLQSRFSEEIYACGKLKQKVGNMNFEKMNLKLMDSRDGKRYYEIRLV